MQEATVFGCTPYTLLYLLVQGWRDALGNNRFAAGANSVSQPSTAPSLHCICWMQEATGRRHRELVCQNVRGRTHREHCASLVPRESSCVRLDPGEHSYWGLV